MDTTNEQKPSAWHPLSLGVTQSDIEALAIAKEEIKQYSRNKRVYTINYKGCIIQTTNPHKFENYYGKKLV